MQHYLPISLPLINSDLHGLFAQFAVFILRKGFGLSLLPGYLKPSSESSPWSVSLLGIVELSRAVSSQLKLPRVVGWVPSKRAAFAFS